MPLIMLIAAQEAPGFDPTPILVAAIAGLLGAIPGFLAYRASTRANANANAISARKVDQEAYDRAVIFYQKQLDDANKQLDRVQTQVDALYEQLKRATNELFDKQENESQLRSQLRSLQITVDVLNSTIAELKARLETRVMDP